MSENTNKIDRTKAFFWTVLIVLAAYIVIKNAATITILFKVLLGFGAMIMVHEFGHFVAAKLSDIKVEAFSIGFPPTILGILRTESGYRIRILPGTTADGQDKQLGEFTVKANCKAGETEYRVGLIPFGGYVKMLGQEDIGQVKSTDDPRSYANKSVGRRMGVIAAGVIFNALSAVIFFMIAFLVGIELPPPIVGQVIPESPAARAGLQPGDEIIEINGKSKNLDFSNIIIAAALSKDNQKVPVKIRHQDGSVEELSLVPERIGQSRTKIFGIVPPLSLKIAEVDDATALVETTHLLPGDKIISVNGQDVQHYWQLEQIIENCFAPTISLLAERDKPDGSVELVEAKIPIQLSMADSDEIYSENQLHHICGMTPRLRIEAVSAKRRGSTGIIARFFGKRNEPEQTLSLQKGDIILNAGGIEYPTYYELRKVTTEYEDRELPITVLRTNPDGTQQTVELTVRPYRQAGRVIIGVGVSLDAENPIVAKTVPIRANEEPPAIPPGAVITAINGTKVDNFYEIAELIRKNKPKEVKIDYKIGSDQASVILQVDEPAELVTVKSMLGEYIPFAPLERLYRADNPVQAVMMGLRKTAMFIAQTYATLRSLLLRDISAKELMGPIGILHLSYQVVTSQPPIYHIYLIGLMSACIAVFNFLPFPPLDGGHIIFLLAEKIKGSAVDPKIQAAVIYAGWIMIGVLFIYVTLNDILRIASRMLF